MNDGTMATTRFRLSWGECDPAGIVYFAAYFPWMERLHSGWWFDRGLRFDRMLDLIGAHPVTRSTQCGFLAPARVLDPLVMTMRLDGLGTTSFSVAFEVVDELDPAAPVRVAESRIDLVFVDGTSRPVPVPPTARRALDRASGAGRPP